MIKLEAVTKIYKSGDSEISALDGVDIRFSEGEFCAIVGSSGSGKSTLMNILGLLDRPSRGKVFFFDEDVSRLAPDRLSMLRSRCIGFVFQNFSLIQGMTALENVEMPLVFAGVRESRRRARAQAALEAVGLEARMSHQPHQLSGGQQQRVAIARAMVGDPSVVLADEPTGNLDPASGGEVLRLLRSLQRSGRTVILITHDMSIAAAAGRVVRLEAGKILA